VDVNSEPIALEVRAWGCIHFLDKLGEVRLASSRYVAACVGMGVHSLVLAFAVLFLRHSTLMVLLGRWIVPTGVVVVLHLSLCTVVLTINMVFLSFFRSFEFCGFQEREPLRE
jgi:uncharacterized integral membrane protein